MRVFIALACVGIAVGQVCKAPPPLVPFNIEEYLGVWYQVAVSRRFFETIERKYPRCIYANYTLNPARTINVENVGFNAAGERNVAIGKAVQPVPMEAFLEVSFGGSPPGPYSIIKMLYDGNGKFRVALVWSCAYNGLVDDLWVLARTRTITSDDYSAMLDFASASGIPVDRLDMVLTNQTGCATGTAVDECRLAQPVSGFNASQYLGVWYQIAVTRRFFETTERKCPDCITANYSVNKDGTVNVVNTGNDDAGHVTVARGKATVPDPSVGLLEVSFFDTPPGPYTIIKLLYDEHGQYRVSLVWTCVAGGLVNDLWILSRTRHISEQDFQTMILFANSHGIDTDKLGIIRNNQSNCNG